MRNYNNFRAAVLNKMSQLFPNDGTQYQWNLWEDCSTLVPVEGYNFYELSYRIRGFGMCGVRFFLDDSKENVTNFWFFTTLPGMGDNTKKFKTWVENDLGNEPETDPISQLLSFNTTGGNAAKVLKKHTCVIESSYHEHYNDGDIDDTFDGLDCKAAVGTVVNVDGIDYVCVYRYETDSQDRGWSGCTNTTYWVRLIALNTYADRLLLDEATLMQDSVTITGADIETLLNLPIDWTDLIGYHRGVYDSYSYLYGSRVDIIVCEKYVTVHIIETRNSSKRQCGWEYIADRIQFLLDGTDNTVSYVAYCKRKSYAEKIATLVSDGLSVEQAKLWLKSRATWKHENKPSFCFEQAKFAEKDFWLKLSGARGWKHAEKIIANAGLSEELSWFTGISFPRATDTCALIAQLCTETMSGSGWTLTKEVC